MPLLTCNKKFSFGYFIFFFIFADQNRFCGFVLFETYLTIIDSEVVVKKSLFRR